MQDTRRAAWRKSSRSGSGNACVEVAGLDSGTAVRDSKDPTGPVLSFSPAQWAAFTQAISQSQFG